MAPQAKVQWALDQNCNEWYYFDSLQSCWIYQSGRRVYSQTQSPPIPPTSPILSNTTYPQNQIPRNAREVVSDPPTQSSHSRDSSEGSAGSLQYQFVNKEFSRLSVQDDEISRENNPRESATAAPERQGIGGYDEKSTSNQAEAQSFHNASGQSFTQGPGNTFTAPSRVSWSQGIGSSRVGNQPSSAPSLPAAGQGYYTTNPSPAYPITTPGIVRTNYDQALQDLPQRKVIDGPPNAITDPALLQLEPSVKAHKKFVGTDTGQTEKLDPSFFIRFPGGSFFKIGRVFKVLWPELASDKAEGITTASQKWATDKKFGEAIFVKIRWFVVVREGHNACSCLPIQTYGGRGVADKIKSHHAIIYTGSTPPEPLTEERPRHHWELPLGHPIRVVPTKIWEKLDPISRVNFQKIYTVEHNVKVSDFGRVAKESEVELVHQFNEAWGITISPGKRRTRISHHPSGGTNTTSQETTEYAQPTRASEHVPPENESLARGANATLSNNLPRTEYSPASSTQYGTTATSPYTLSEATSYVTTPNLQSYQVPIPDPRQTTVPRYPQRPTLLSGQSASSQQNALPPNPMYNSQRQWAPSSQYRGQLNTSTGEASYPWIRESSNAAAGSYQEVSQGASPYPQHGAVRPSFNQNEGGEGNDDNDDDDDDEDQDDDGEDTERENPPQHPNPTTQTVQVAETSRERERGHRSHKSKPKQKKTGFWGGRR